MDLDSLKGLGCHWLQEYISTQPDLQKKLAVCLDPQTLKAAAPALVADARIKLIHDQKDDAILLFKEAKKLDRELVLDADVENMIK